MWLSLIVPQDIVVRAGEPAVLRMGGRRSFALAAPGNAKPLFLPTYVHDFNPIGRPFAKLKT